MKVTLYGRMWFSVESESRKEMVHFIDLEHEAKDDGTPDPRGYQCKCSCEAFNLLMHRPCKHIRRVVEWVMLLFGFSSEEIDSTNEAMTAGVNPADAIRAALASKANHPPIVKPPEPKKRIYKLRQGKRNDRTKPN